MKTLIRKALVMIFMAAPLMASAQQVTNRYAMKLDANPDGSYSLQKAERYAKIVDINSIEDLLVPYTYEAKDLKGKLYNKVVSTEYVYKHCDGYDLKLIVDQAVSDQPTPFVIHCHGGGWSRGDAESGRSLTKYLAQQHGITGVRVEYSLYPKPGLDVHVSIQDVLDAVKYMRDNAAMFNIDPKCVGFIGTSAGAHLAACAAMMCPDAKVFVGYSGIYDLTTAAIVQRSKDKDRIAYFCDRDERELVKASPVYLIGKKTKVAAQLFCGTADLTVEYSQSQAFAAALKARKGCSVELNVYPNYDHNLSSKTSDKMEEIFFKSAAFVAEHLK
ncbi:MAG: alpha/beta hydrolase [Bacteroidales bacterium]|nr:alpha/beta hydrolase [Bacteroidales bacterium]